MDFLRECMNDAQNPPLDQFQRNWCTVCANRECERAGMNNSAFDRRAKNWKSLLFDNVPRADPDDPSYDNIRSRVFLPSGQKAAEVKVFIPGTPVAEPPEAPMPRPAAFVSRQPAPAPPPAAPQGQAVDLSPAASAPESPEQTSAPPVASPGNTVFQQGAMLDGAPPPVPPARPATDQAASDPGGKTFILDD